MARGKGIEGLPFQKDERSQRGRVRKLALLGEEMLYYVSFTRK